MTRYAKGWTICDSIPGRDKRMFFAEMPILSPVHTHLMVTGVSSHGGKVAGA